MKTLNDVKEFESNLKSTTKEFSAYDVSIAFAIAADILMKSVEKETIEVGEAGEYIFDTPGLVQDIHKKMFVIFMKTLFPEIESYLSSREDEE